MNSKLGEEQKKKGYLVRRSPNFDSNSDKKQKKGQNDNGLILKNYYSQLLYSTLSIKGTVLVRMVMTTFKTAKP